MAWIVRRRQQPMILTVEEEHRLLFQYSGKKSALTTGSMGACLLAAAGFLAWQNGFSVHVAAFILFGMLLAANAVFSSRSESGMEIDRVRGSIRYAEKAVRRKDIWEKSFSEFASISVHYPRKERSTRRHGRRPVVEIVSRDGEYFPVMKHAPGVSPDQSARDLASMVGGMMNLPVVASIGKN